MVHAYVLPEQIPPGALAGGVAVVIDQFRASTTICAALAAGARAVHPWLTADEARAMKAADPKGEVLLGGERRGVLIEGFDLANSPTEYTPATVGGRTVVFTTTNGTRALLRCKLAEEVYVGAFVNATAVVERLMGRQQIHLVCAGTAGQYSRDDVLFAGLLVERLQRLSGLPYEMNAQALTARENWVSSFALPQAIGAEPLPPDLLAGELRKSIAGQNLVGIGREDDIRTAAQIDQFRCIPRLDRGSFRIRLA